MTILKTISKSILSKKLVLLETKFNENFFASQKNFEKRDETKKKKIKKIQYFYQNNDFIY